MDVNIGKVSLILAYRLVMKLHTALHITPDVSGLYDTAIITEKVKAVTYLQCNVCISHVYKGKYC